MHVAVEISRNLINLKCSDVDDTLEHSSSLFEDLPLTLELVVIVLAETWLFSDIIDEMIALDNYNVFRCDRSSHRGGEYSNCNSNVYGLTNEAPHSFAINDAYNSHKRLKSSIAAGSDRIPPTALKMLSRWRQFVVIPIFKKD
ncbi:hypothetical protein GJ496_006900 [Pomphorhynchus laevis]|nr:hypothetical protein GJ496_006900 [Pomphorhynchus laevis]